MKDDAGTLLTLAGYFAVMSLFAIGGANSAVPEMQRVAVEVERWMTARQFSDIFAIAQVTPGPNVIIVTLIGYHVAGFAGALVATLAMCGPTSLLAFYVGGMWERFKDAPWVRSRPACFRFRSGSLRRAPSWWHRRRRTILWQWLRRWRRRW
jgi:chromate transporter